MFEGKHLSPSLDFSNIRIDYISKKVEIDNQKFNMLFSVLNLFVSMSIILFPICIIVPLCLVRYRGDWIYSIMLGWGGLLIYSLWFLMCYLYVKFFRKRAIEFIPYFSTWVDLILLYTKKLAKRGYVKITEPIIVIPFRNMILKYHATGEFSEYLTNINILEVREEEPEFDAIFVFSKIPKSGEIKVEYR